MNQGVQGGSGIFHHTMGIMGSLGYRCDPVKLQVSFGKGENFWTNVFPTELLARHEKEIKRFVKVMQMMRWFEVFFALMPIRYFLKLFLFSEEFTNTIILPMVALFLGTGNATPMVPAIMLERLCTSPTYGMWYPLDSKSLVKNLPPMVVFPRLSTFYDDWRKSLEKKGVTVRLSTELTQVVKRDKHGVTVRLIQRQDKGDVDPEPNRNNPNSAWVPYDHDHNADASTPETEEHYDELVLCVLADTAKRLLGPTASWLERFVLGNANFADDITVTHTDASYMQKHYTNFFDPEQAVDKIGGEDQTSRIELAKKEGGEGGFKPMYLIKTYPHDRRKLEMCFDCSNYQGQFPASLPFDRHVFQTIFLNKKSDQKHWNIDEIDESKVIRKDWWHQVCHSYTHYTLVVPFLFLIHRLITPRTRTRYAGAWTLVNAHEVAVMSGIAAAVHLGGEYPVEMERKSRFALLCFRLYSLLVYGMWYRGRGKEELKRDEGEGWGEGVYGSVWKGPGFSGRERSMWLEDSGKEWGPVQKGVNAEAD